MVDSETSLDARTAAQSIRVGQATYHIGTERLFDATKQNFVLRAQTARVLHLLALDFGRLVSRERLLDEVWPGLSVTDDSLTQCISEIRRAVQDSDRVILKTVPKRGFVLNAQAIKAGANPIKTSEAKQRGSSPGRILDERDLFPTLAVLPFQEIEGGARPIGAFWADEVIHAISQADDLNVVSRLSTFGVEIENYELNQLGKALNADYILSGAVLETGAQTTLLTEFSETSNGYVLFSKKLRLPSEDLLQSQIGVEQIILHIRRHISANEIQKVRSNPLENLQLYSILRGSVALMHRLSRDDFQLSRRQLEHLIGAAPHHPAPKAWMARWHVLRAVQGWSEDMQGEAREALVWTSRALQIDPDNSLAMVCEGQALTHLSRDLGAAKERYDTALSLNPNDANGIALRGMLASFQDDSELGVKLASRALRLTPLDPLRFFYLALSAGAHVSAQEFDRAAELAETSLSLNRSHVSTWRTLTAAYQGAGKHDLAAETAGKVMALQPDLTVGKWLAASPSAEYDNGKLVAELLRVAGIPE